MAGEFSQFPHRHPVGGIGQPAGIAEGRFRQAEFAGALGHEVGGKYPLVAGHALGQRNAGIIAALDDRALQQVVDRHLAVENGKHGRAAGRRAALAPGVLADPVFVRQLDLAFLDGVEDHLDRHQLHHAGRRPQFVGVLLEQHAAAGRLDQDRGRRVAVKAALFLLRRALHAVVGGVHDPAPTDRERDDGSHQAAPRDDGRGVGFAGNGSLGCHRRCPESLRSNSWKYRKQHGFGLASDLPPCRSDCGAGRRNVSWRCCNFADKIRKTRRKRDAILTHHFRQRAGLLCCRGRARVRWCCSATAGPNYPIPGGTRSRRLAAAGFHVVAPDMRGFGRTSAPADVGAYTIFHNVGDMVALVAALGEKQAVIVGHDWGAPVAWHAAMFRPDVFTKVAGLSVPPPSRGRGLPLETLRQNGITNFYWQYFQPPGVAEAEFERDVAATMRIVLGGRGFSDPAAHQYVQEGKGFLAGADPNRPLPNWLTEADLAYFAAVYQDSGFRGGLNWYRNIDRNWELTAPWQGAQIHQPSLFIAGSKDWRHHRADRRQTGQRDGARAAEFAAEAHPRRRRSLDPAGAARRGQRRPDRLPEGLIQPCARSALRWAPADRPAGKPGSGPHSWLHSRRTRRAGFPRRGRASGWRPTFPRSH